MSMLRTQWRNTYTVPPALLTAAHQLATTTSCASTTVIPSLPLRVGACLSWDGPTLRSPSRRAR
jgi:hypothetical protein